MKQKDAVFAALTQVFSENNIPFESGTNVSPLLSKEMRIKVTNLLLAGFQSGEISMSTKFSANTKQDVSKLRTYVSGLISNYLRKDVRLNGGVAHTHKSPGSRKSSGDAQLKALRALLSQATNDGDREEIQNFIDIRIEELNTGSKAKVDVTQLPEALSSRLNL